MSPPETGRRDSGLPALDPLEIASGVIYGPWREFPPEDPEPIPGTAAQVLPRVMIPALTRPPCLVAFSGGRDSSAVLAFATHVARREGLDDPVPVTLRYPEHQRTHEDEWQESLVRHLGLGEWKILELTDELEALGPIATGALRRRGVYWPPNAHSMFLLGQAAAAGSLMTGNGGDELFTPWAWPRPSLEKPGDLVRNRERLKYLGYYYAPTRVRRAIWQTKWKPELPWLRPEAAAVVVERTAEKMSVKSPSWSVDLEELLHSRYREVGYTALATMTRDAGAQLIEPFADPRFVRAFVAEAPPRGHLSRAHAMATLFSEVLPESSMHRATKAVFTEVNIGPRVREFVAGWDGGGVDTELVDPVALRAEWSKPKPDFRSLTPLQAAWLATVGRDGGS